MAHKTIKPGSYILSPSGIPDYIHNMRVMAQDCINYNRSDPFNPWPETPGACQPLRGCSLYDAIFGRGTDNEIRTAFILAGTNNPTPPHTVWWDTSTEVQSMFLLFYILHLEDSSSS